VWLRLGSRVEANLLHDEPGDRALDVAFRIDGTTLGTVTLAPHAWTDVSVDVPPALRGNVARLTIAPERTWSPLDHGVKDDARTLGVSVRKVSSA
jgi:hypothetical protein